MTCCQNAALDCFCFLVVFFFPLFSSIQNWVNKWPICTCECAGPPLPLPSAEKLPCGFLDKPLLITPPWHAALHGWLVSETTHQNKARSQNNSDCGTQRYHTTRDWLTNQGDDILNTQKPKNIRTFFKLITSSRRSLKYPWVSWGVETQHYSHVVISVMSSAELWQPCTTLLVHSERSRLVSVLNRWVSIPCLVPVRVAKDKSIPDCGEPFPGPEWTNLQVDLKMHRWIVMLTQRTVPNPYLSTALLRMFLNTRSWEHANLHLFCIWT